jgi:hypothetical protein
MVCKKGVYAGRVMGVKRISEMYTKQMQQGM